MMNKIFNIITILLLLFCLYNIHQLNFKIKHLETVTDTFSSEYDSTETTNLSLRILILENEIKSLKNEIRDVDSRLKNHQSSIPLY